MRNWWVKLVLVALFAVAVRIGLEFVIPASELNDLMLMIEASALSQSSFFPLVFTIYAWISYFMIALFAVDLAETSGRHQPGRIIGLIAVLWVVYLLEPLPSLDYSDFFKENFFVAFKYQIADSLALLVMGLIVGMLYKKIRPAVVRDTSALSVQSSRLLVPFVLYYLTVVCLRFLLDQAEWAWGINPQTLRYLLWCLMICLLNFFIYLYLAGGFKQTHAVKALRLLMFNILFFNFFVLLIVKVNPLNLALRGLADYLPLLWLRIPYKNIHEKI